MINRSTLTLLLLPLFSNACDKSDETAGGWRWLDGTEMMDTSGTAVDYAKWSVDLYCDQDLDPGCQATTSDPTGTDQDFRPNNQPNDSGEGQPVMGFGEMNTPVATWGDYMGTVAEYGMGGATPGSSFGFIMEFEVDPGL